MVIAITGASGLLGRTLVNRLHEAGIGVIAVIRKNNVQFPEGVIVREADVLDNFAVAEALQGAEGVIHAAGLVSFNPRLRDEILRTNVEGTRIVVNACLQMGIKTFIQVSSVSALGRTLGGVITENDPWTGQYANDYGTSKYLAELEVYRGAEEGLTVSLVNPSVILSGQALHRSSAALFDYVWKERPFYTDGILNYVDVLDVADALVTLVKKPQPGERFILSAGSVNYLEFFTRVATQWKKRPPSFRIPGGWVQLFGMAEEIRCRLTGAEPLVTRHSAAMTVRNFRYDTSKATRLLNIHYRSLDETIGRCCTEYAEHVNGNK